MDVANDDLGLVLTHGRKSEFAVPLNPDLVIVLLEDALELVGLREALFNDEDLGGMGHLADLRLPQVLGPRKRFGRGKVIQYSAAFLLAEHFLVTKLN